MINKIRTTLYHINKTLNPGLYAATEDDLQLYMCEGQDLVIMDQSNAIHVTASDERISAVCDCLLGTAVHEPPANLCPEEDPEGWKQYMDMCSLILDMLANLGKRGYDGETFDAVLARNSSTFRRDEK